MSRSTKNALMRSGDYNDVMQSCTFINLFVGLDAAVSARMCSSDFWCPSSLLKMSLWSFLESFILHVWGAVCCIGVKHGQWKEKTK